MNAPDILKAMEADGLTAELHGGGVKLAGPREAVKRWSGTVAENKVEIMTALQSNDRWELWFDAEPVVLALTTPATREEVMEWYPSAMRIEPYIEPLSNPYVPMTREEAEVIDWYDDDRRRCRHCLNLLSNGICKVASPGGLVSAAKNYRPVDMLRRCEGYRPCLDDPDRRPGWERWPGLAGDG